MHTSSPSRSTLTLTLAAALLLAFNGREARAQSARSTADSMRFAQVVETLLRAARTDPAVRARPMQARSTRTPSARIAAGATSRRRSRTDTGAPVGNSSTQPSRVVAAGASPARGLLRGPAPPAVRRAAKAYRDEGKALGPVTVAGRRRVPFGHARAVLECRPLRVSAIRLQPGEKVLSTSAGNQEDWAIQLAQSGSGGRTPVLMVKPLTTAPMRTNLIVTTTRRIYQVVLSSPGRQPADAASLTDGSAAAGSVPSILQFYYPDDLVRTWARASAASATRSRRATTRPALNLNPSIALEEMNYGYRWDRGGRFPWKPTSVFDDGEHVYIVLPEAAASAPGAALFVKGLNGQNTMLNYAVRGNMIITDRLFREAVFIYSEPTGDEDVDKYKLTIYRKDD